MSTISVDADKPATPKAASRAKRARRRAEARRWIREARGIVALAVASFAVVSLAMFDPALPPAEQATSVGPVGWWLRRLGRARGPGRPRHRDRVENDA